MAKQIKAHKITNEDGSIRLKRLVRVFVNTNNLQYYLMIKKKVMNKYGITIKQIMNTTIKVNRELKR